TFTSANVSPKGTMQFVSNVSGGNNVCLPATTYNYAIFPFWDDFSSNPKIAVYTEVIGTAPNRIYEYAGVGRSYHLCVHPDSVVGREVVPEGEDGVVVGGGR